MNKKIIFSLVLIFLAISAYMCGCDKIFVRSEEPFRTQIFALDTIIDLTIYDSRGEEISRLSEQRIKELEHKMSATVKDSEITKINSSNGEPTVRGRNRSSLKLCGLFNNKTE